jgi:putative membrane-bound dehydrogenase-like protein
MRFRLLLSITLLTVSSGRLPAQYTEGIAVREARDKAWTPGQEQKAIELDGAYDVQLVASEPLVVDPVEVTWDAKGRCFVADMIDYPLGPPEGQKPLSRIVQLLDPDRNGRYTKSKVFAEHVDHVQGLLPYNDGLIATTRTQILFLRDTNGDGVADEIKPLVDGFNPNHSQLQVASPRWGLDNCVYFNNGLNSSEIYPVATPEARMKVARTNLRWDPSTGKLELATGNGQYGGCFDDWGHHFFCSNRNPVMFAVMPHEAVVRNSHAGITQGWEDIAPTGAEAKVYPLQLSHTTADAHAGTHTAACGLGVYRGDLMPELRGEIFVCEPTAQAVVRYHVESNGSSLKATRVGDHKEFFRSHDEWTRPVNVTTGPDGALYICDIYRRYIDHARFFPEAFVKSHDMRAGDHEGRIWRVVPKGVGGVGVSPASSAAGILPAAKEPGKMPGAQVAGETPTLRRIEPAPSEVEGLVAWLGHKNAWQRETAQRLLVGRKAEAMALLAKLSADPKLPDVSRLHVFGLLSAWSASEPAAGAKDFETAMGQSVKQVAGNMRLLSEIYLAIGPKMWGDDPMGLGQLLRSNDPRVAYVGAVCSGTYPRPDTAANLLTALRRFPEDVWIQRAVVSSALGKPGVMAPCFGDLAKGLLADRQFVDHFSTGKAELIRTLSSQGCNSGDKMDFSELLSVILQSPGKLLWWKPALLQGLAEGLPKSGGQLGVKSLAELTSKPPEAYKEAAAEITALLDQVDKVMADSAAPQEQRLAVIPLLGQRTWDKAEPLLRGLLADGQSPQISAAALGVLRKFSSEKTAPLLYELLPKAGPAERRDIVTMLSSGKTLLDFLQRMDRGEVPKSIIGVEQRWGLGRNANPQIKELAAKLFGTVSSDRAAVITAYMDATRKKGDPQKGHQVFQMICITCHKIRGEGVEVGPDITDVRIKPPEALLTDILDPNRICEPRFMAYQVDTKDGRVVAGLVSAENNEGVTLKLAGGVTEAVPRSNIKAMKCLDQSLMPVGVEATISKEQMADLMAFLRGE